MSIFVLFLTHVPLQTLGFNNYYSKQEEY